ncbi:N-acetyltransferase [Antarcticimicrobium luteum]|uniref:N-acetyltransferase n=2 Tax=Antarcticimicrobium luteum TaxID=2547397 RepID=A0A4R5UQV5_9RHOB|nr:GNAT family protein [Antarcticimicrobium luteum]TDK41438.1 N-acetyltransferase [Antarcticimicrobium luteum]
MTTTDPDRPLGPPVHTWTPPPAPTGAVLEGRHARLEPLSAEAHAALLFRAYEGHDWLWDYMAYGPFHSAAQYHRWVRDTVANTDHLFYAIRDLDSGGWGGVASYLRIKPQMGVIEVGNINLSPALQRTRAATEAVALMMGWAFDAGYRRYEWKCDALNRPSRAAAQRLGFSYEGVFRQHMVIKGRNRDTAWFAVTDTDWPALREAFAAWLSPSNFTADGGQVERLSDLTRLVRVGADPSL